MQMKQEQLNTLRGICDIKIDYRQICDNKIDLLTNQNNVFQMTPLVQLRIQFESKNIMCGTGPDVCTEIPLIKLDPCHHQQLP